MRECPGCGRLTLELDPATNRWTCLVVPCGYSESGKTLEERVLWLEKENEVIKGLLERIVGLLK